MLKSHSDGVRVSDTKFGNGAALAYVLMDLRL